MTRPLRVEFSGALYHIMARGNERRTMFARDAERQVWRKRGDENLRWIHREVDIEEARRWVRDVMKREPDRR